MAKTLKAGDKFWFDHNEWRVVSIDCRENRFNVAIDRGCDAAGNERRYEVSRIADGFHRRLSEAEIDGKVSK